MEHHKAVTTNKVNKYIHTLQISINSITNKQNKHKQHKPAITMEGTISFKTSDRLTERESERESERVGKIGRGLLTYIMHDITFTNINI